MLIKRWLRWLLLALLVAVVYLGFRLWSGAQAPAPPAFYTAALPLPVGPPGLLLNSEPLPAALPKGAQAWRILYLSTGMQGEPVAVSAIVVAPDEPVSRPRPVIAWAHGTVGVLPQCGVSHTKDPYQQTPSVQLMIDEGFVVVATDYLGLGTPQPHPYLVGPVTAYSVLDSVRAAQQLDIGAGDDFVVWGASQGGHASLWTAELASDYAPELTLLGAAASAPAVNLASILEANMDNMGGGIFVSEVLYAWSRIYPSVDLDLIIRPEFRAQFEKLATTCVSTISAFLFVGDIIPPSTYLFDTLDADAAPWSILLAENTPDGPISVPILITHGGADSLIPIELSEAEAARRCALGEQVTFVRLPGAGHDARHEAATLTIGWIQDRFAGRPSGPTCAD